MTHRLANGLWLPDQGHPAGEAGGLHFYSRRWAGRSWPLSRSDTGVPLEIQGLLAARKAVLLVSNGTTGVSGFGAATTVTGGTTRNPNHAAFFTAQRRIGLQSAATAGQLATCRVTQTLFALGQSTSPSFGGFFFFAEFGINTLGTAPIVFAGLSSAALGVTATPATATNYIGAWIWPGGGSGTRFFMASRGASGTEQTVDLGTDFPTGAGVDFYRLRMWAAPGATSVGYCLIRLTQPAQAAAEGTLSTNLPAATQGLAPNVQHSNNATAEAVSTDLSVLYCESDR